MQPLSTGPSLITVNEQTFEREVLTSELPVAVVFMAAWSNPWKSMEPDVLALAQELEGKVKFVKIDTDRSPTIAREFQLKSIPAVAVVAQGRVVAAKQGMLKRPELRTLIEPFLPRSEAAVRVEELVKLIKAARVQPIDTREATSFARAHIPGAMNIPLDQLITRADALASTGLIPVLYCRGGLESKPIAEQLAEQGYPVAFLEGGFLAWEVAGQNIERS